MSGDARERSAPGGVVAVAPSGASGRHASIEERRRLVAESLRVGNPGNNARDLPVHADPRHDCQIELEVDDIRPYEHNPRRANNAKFAEIKESIRACGMRNPLTVTRRPGEAHFIVEAGGNTRLLAIQQLWTETHEPRFKKLTVLFRPWRAESYVLTAHLIENEQRGEMTFWDKANGVVALKAQLEAEKGRTLSLRQLEEELKGIGMSVNTATLTHYLFASDRLRTLGDAVTDLSGLDVKTIQPRLNLMKRYAQMRASIAEVALYAAVFEPVFRRHADEYRQTQAFGASAVCQACEEALAQYLSEPVIQLRMVLDTLAQSSQVSLETLLAQSGTRRSASSAESAPAIGDRAPDRAPAVSTANTASGKSREHSHPIRAALHSNDEHSAVLQRLTEQVKRFAGLAGVGDCLRLHAAAPHGYFMETPPSPVDGDSQPPLKHRAWWLLALISGQLDDSVSLSPPGSSGEGRPGPGAELDRAGSEPPETFVFNAAFFAWLLDAHDEAAGAFWEIVALIRELRASAPRRYAATDTVRQRARRT